MRKGVISSTCLIFVLFHIFYQLKSLRRVDVNIGIYEGWNFNSGNYLFTTDTT